MPHPVPTKKARGIIISQPLIVMLQSKSAQLRLNKLYYKVNWTIYEHN